MTLIKRNFSALLLLCAIGIFMASCQKENLQANTQDTTRSTTRSTLGMLNGDNDNDGGTVSTNDEDDCFTFVYPIQLNFPEGTETTVNSDDELFTALDNWYEAQGEDTEEDPTFNYPISVQLANGATQSIANDDALEDLFEECYGDYDDYDDHHDDHHGGCEELCFDFQFPITISQNGSNVTINNEDELDDIFESDNDFEFVFPLTVTVDGESTTVNNEDELWDICGFDYDDDYEDHCFDFNFPITLADQNGNNVTINSEDEFENLEDNSTTHYELVFPVSITLKDNDSVVTVNSEDELDEVLEASCGGHYDHDDEYEDLCFEVVFPITAVVGEMVDSTITNGTTVTINNEDELENLLEGEQDFEVNFPISVTLEDGTTATVNSEDELFDLCD